MQSHHHTERLEVTLKSKAEVLDVSQALSSLCLPKAVFLRWTPRYLWARAGANCSFPCLDTDEVWSSKSFPYTSSQPRCVCADELRACRLDHSSGWLTIADLREYCHSLENILICSRAMFCEVWECVDRMLCLDLKLYRRHMGSYWFGTRGEFLKY